MKALLLIGLSICATASPALAHRVIIDKEAMAAWEEAAGDQRANRGAISRCDRALSWEVTTRGRDRVATFVNRGILHMVRNDMPGAMADFDAALALDPEEGEAWLGKAIGYSRSGDLASAKESASKAIAFGTDRPAMAYFIRGMAFESQGNLQAAHADLRMARQLAPKWADARMELARYETGNR